MNNTTDMANITAKDYLICQSFTACMQGIHCYIMDSCSSWPFNVSHTSTR